MRPKRGFGPRLLEALEGRVVLSSGAASATAGGLASAGDVSSGPAILAAFGQEVQQGLAPTLTVDFGTTAASGPAGTLDLPIAAYSSSLGYGWLSNLNALEIQNGAVTGKNGDFEIDVPPGTYDVTVSPTTSPSISTGSLVAAFAADNTLGGPGAFFENPGLQPVTLRTTVFKSGAGNGLIIAMNGGFALQSVQITPVQVTGAIGLFTPTQPAPAVATGIRVSRSHGHLSVKGTAQSSVLVSESGTITWNEKTAQEESGSVNLPTADTALNWDLQFPQTSQDIDPNTQSRAPVTGVIESISLPGDLGTGGTFMINTPRGRLKLGVKYPANTLTAAGLPFDDLLSSVALRYKIRGGTGAFRDAKGSGIIDVSLTLTDQSVEGTVTNGVLNSSVAEGTFTLIFQPGT
jgi:hypothetical protein